jgi:thymidylate kinase
MNHGLCVAVMGPDGAGKSRLVAGLRTTYPRPITVLKMSAAMRAPIRGPAGARWLVRTVRSMRALVGARFDLLRGRVVVWDRHPLEDRAMAVEGRLVLGQGRSWLARLAPRPHVVVILDAPVAVLSQRRPEHAPAQLERFRAIYRAIAREHQAIVVDGSRPVDEVRDEVVARLRQFEADGPLPEDDHHAVA